MRQIPVVLLFVLYGSTFGQNENDLLNEKLDRFLLESQTAGVSAAYAINDTIVWQSAAGYADIKENKVFKTNTKTRMASIAKSMTALAIMQLWERSLLDLDAPIQTYIPEYPKQPTTQITTRHLLSHTSGISGYANNKERNNTRDFSSLTEALEVFKDRKLLFEPGTRYSYTTYGYTILGVIIERISNMAFEDYMQKHIWDKAAMADTGVARYGALSERTSKIYRRKGGKGQAKEGMETNLSDRIPGGGLYTTVTDMIKFGNAVINNVFVTSETFELMRQHHSLEKERNGYGFGWFLYGSKPNEGAIIGHSGAQMGCSSQLWIVPEKKVVVIVLANTSRVEVGGFANELLKMAFEESKIRGS